MVGISSEVKSVVPASLVAVAISPLPAAVIVVALCDVSVEGAMRQEHTISEDPMGDQC